ncbi:MAG: adenylyltransferase/cytidyltransferase family protein [Alphaproteobacteria bacterium]|nr:adenylyltransferase/cytidyltransferase family protein [Alphaproteobacteria bacterium]
MDDAKYQAKIKTIDELKREIGPRPRDRSVVMCHGTFDVVHPGHVRHLMYAKGKADVLVASLTCDEHIEKANFRPFVPENLRALNLAALDMVDYVLIDPSPTPLRNLEEIQPDYFAKGYEYVAEGMPPATQEEKKVLDTFGGEFIFTPGDIVYSSSKIIETMPPDIASDKLYMLLDAEGLSFQDLRDALDGFDKLTVHVVGDTILDSYTQTTMIGGQTKTPTMSVRFEDQTTYVGGAGIVAKHLRAGGANVVFTTVLGDDPWCEFTKEDLAEDGVELRAIISKNRPTTNKNAIICGGYRLLKIDTLDNRPISHEILEEMCEGLRGTKSDAVVFSDFRHGIFNAMTIPTLIESIPDSAFRVADSQVASRWGNICDFQNFDLITPNEREARFSLGDQDSVIRPLALKLYREANCRNLILTLGERGLLAYRPRHQVDHDVRSFFVIDSFAGNVVDAVGSGDALLSYATLAHAAHGNEVVATVLGAMAGAVECEREGNVPVTPADIIEKINQVERRATFSSA